jgi:hypothetical protein
MLSVTARRQTRTPLREVVAMRHPPAFILFAASIVLAGCTKLAEIAGAPNRDAANVTILVPPNILVGDTIQAKLSVTDRNGKPPLGDTTVTWHSSDPAAISVDGRGRISSNVVGAHATISASVQKVTGSVNLTVGDDQRLAYALADQSAAAGPYSPDANYRFNSSGGAISVTRASTGTYTVRFAGLGRAFVGQRDNMQVSGYGGAGGIFCKLAGWESVGSDLTADVRCFTPAGAAADSRFTILLSGARPYVAGSRLGFTLTPDFGGQITRATLDSFSTSRNNFTGVVTVDRGSVGTYFVQFPGLERNLTAGAPPGTTGPENVQITAVGAGPERCRLAAINSQQAAITVGCTTTGGTVADSRFSLLWLTRGRPGPDFRFGYAFADRATSTTDYAPTANFARNNSGGTITAREITSGQYRITFGGLARPPGAKETVLVSEGSGDDGICTVTSWANSGSADLAVNVSCFDVGGNPAPRTFFILVIE